jgi:hypothetical protein
MPKGQAKGRIVPIRFTADDLKVMAKDARSYDQNMSEWIRRRVVEDKWTTIREDGKKMDFAYRELARDIAEMKKQVEGDIFAQLLTKSGLSLPLKREEVEKQFYLVPDAKLD